MLDIKIIRENPDLVRKAIADRHDTAPVDEVLRLDAERRQNIVKLDKLRQERKVVSKERENTFYMRGNRALREIAGRRDR